MSVMDWPAVKPLAEDVKANEPLPEDPLFVNTPTTWEPVVPFRMTMVDASEYTGTALYVTYPVSCLIACFLILFKVPMNGYNVEEVEYPDNQSASLLFGTPEPAKCCSCP